MFKMGFHNLNGLIFDINFNSPNNEKGITINLFQKSFNTCISCIDSDQFQ